MLNITDLGKYEKSLSNDERRRLDLINQVLNNHSNYSEEKFNVSELFRLYGNILAKDKPIMLNSIQSTIEVFQDKAKLQSAIKSLQKNNSESFLIVPLMSDNHMFATVIRKNENGYSATIVNKGDRGYHNQFVDFQVSNEKIDKFAQELNKANGNVETSRIYALFEKHSDYSVELNIQSKDQKVGNCFIKEPENAIKYAFATRNFNMQDFDNLKEGKLKFQPKWDLLTDKMHERFVQEIIKENPNMNDIAKHEYEIYSKNKIFRDTYNLDKAFGKFNIEEQLRWLNADSLRSGAHHKISNKIKDDELSHKLREISKYASLEHDLKINEVDRLNELGKQFPVATRQIKYEAHGNYLINSINTMYNALQKNNVNLQNKTMKMLDITNALYPYNFLTHTTKAIANMEFYKDSHTKLEEAVENFSTSLNLKQMASTYYLRSLAHKKLGNSKDAEKDLYMANVMDKSGVERWKGMDKTDIMLEYFNNKDSKKVQKNLSGTSLFGSNGKVYNKDLTKIQSLLKNNLTNEPTIKNPLF